MIHFACIELVKSASKAIFYHILLSLFLLFRLCLF